MPQPTTRKQFTIPVYPHVKKFMQKKYGSASVIRTEEYSTLGKLVTLALLEKRHWKEYSLQFKEKELPSITLQLTHEQCELGPRIHKLLRINIDMDAEFKAHLITWILAGQDLGVPPYRTCRSFLEHFKIDEKEYSLDAAYKYWQRQQRRQT
jgi:hypothetical protein